MKGGHGVLQYINGEKYEVRWHMFVCLHFLILNLHSIYE